MSTNPYTPPNSNDVERAHFTVVAQLRKLVQPLIAAGVTLVLWVAAIAAYAGVFGHPHSNVLAMIVWAASLVLSLIVGIVVVTRFAHDNVAHGICVRVRGLCGSLLPA